MDLKTYETIGTISYIIVCLVVRIFVVIVVANGIANYLGLTGIVWWCTVILIVVIINDLISYLVK